MRAFSSSPHRLARDRKAAYRPAPPGAARMDGQARCAVVGGGIAGLAAATALVERGMRVDLFEQQPYLGGRVAGWPTQLADGTTQTMSRGFHAFFRQYYNLRNLLRRVDPHLAMLTPLDDYPLQHAAGARDSFAGIPRTPPWNALGFTTASDTFTTADLAHMHPRAALHLLDVHPTGIYRQLDHLSADQFLTAVNFPARARHLAFEVFSRSFFAAPENLSAAELALMFHIYFLGSAEGLLFDTAADPFPTALWDPLADHLARHGAHVHTATSALGLTPHHAGGFTLTTAPAHGPGSTHERTYDAVVLALDTVGLKALIDASPHVGDPSWRARIAGLQQAPPFLVSRYWLDSPVHPARPGFLGTAGYGPLDNISVLDRFEGQAVRWAARTGGSVVELHAYATDPHTDRSALQQRLRAELARLYPETATANVLDQRHEWRNDCPLFAPGSYPDRPTITTAHPRLVLAGDLVRTDAPVALMERAATSGFKAANALLGTWHVRGHPLLTVPAQGRTACLRLFARALSPALTSHPDRSRPARTGTDRHASPTPAQT
ncbi:FAD-dependent oxidoreductase [Streptomyces diacarni]|uniref:FAD-dependent oxidoreductase n=1 Tax=Streptomyces diacarni TaxID=2800381 RepID=UPI0033D2C52B